MPLDLLDPIAPPVEPTPTPVPVPPTTIPGPVFPEVPTSSPTVIPPKAGETYDRWAFNSSQISHRDGSQYDLETFWDEANATGYSGKRTNFIVRNVTDPQSLVDQLGEDWLVANPDVMAVMPTLLAVFAKVGKKLGVL